MNKEKTAAPAKTSPGLKLDPRCVGRFTGTLLVICLVTALLLGIVNQLTKPRIDAIQKAKQETAMRNVLAAAAYESVEGSFPDVSAVYRAQGGATDGYVVELSTSGSQGIIEMMVGVDMEGKVTGVSVVSHSETPNIGTKVVESPSVLDRFIGMSRADGEITVNSGSNRFDGVSGATVSSKGVTAGVNAALSAVETLLAKEG